MPSLGELFGKGSAAEQLFVWGVVQQVIGALIGPGISELAQQMNDLTPVEQLSPAELAAAVIRGFEDANGAADSARRAGLENGKFDTLKLLAMSGPSVADLAAAARLGLVSEGATGPTETTLNQGIAEAGLNPKWTDLVRQLSLSRPTPQAILNAYLEGQVDEATAKELYAKLGGDPEYFQLLYDSNGQAPTPSQALELANRGIIPWHGTGPDVVSYEQAFLEGPWRNKWLDPFIALGAYLPPPRTVTAMYRAGELDQAEALDLLQKQGLTPELAAKYVQKSATAATAKDKDLAKTDVVTLYSNHVINRADALSMLGALGYHNSVADYVLQIADLRRSIAAINTAVSRVHTLYVSHKIDQATARSVLAQLEIPGDQVAAMMTAWEAEEAVNVRLPTPSQVAQAFGFEIIDQDTAMTLLQQQGYQPHDAWLLLSVHHKAKLGGEPAADVSPIKLNS